MATVAWAEWAGWTCNPAGAGEGFPAPRSSEMQKAPRERGFLFGEQNCVSGATAQQIDDEQHGNGHAQRPQKNVSQLARLSLQRWKIASHIVSSVRRAETTIGACPAKKQLQASWWMDMKTERGFRSLL